MADVNQLIKDAQTAQSQGNNSLALDYFNQALLQYPNEMSLQIACGNLCVALERFEEAAGHFRRILTTNKSPEVRSALCYALQSLGNQADQDGKYALAEAAFEEALQHQPNNAAYWYNLGNAQRELGKSKAAETSFTKSIQANPNDADTYNNLGNVQRELGQLDLAIQNYKQALALNPNLHHALAHLVHQKQHTCDWQGEGVGSLAQQILDVRHLVKTDETAQISPFAFLAMPSTTADEQKRCASHYIAQNYQHLVALRDTLSFTYSQQKKAKIKVGYLSADFRLHPLAFLITALIEQHNRNAFEITAYSYGAVDQTDTRKRLVNAFDHFVDIRELNDIEAASKINQDQIDILVDLTGYTQSSRTGIVALRPAAIHINWLGFAGTMGEYMGEHMSKHNQQPLFDYLLADETIAPKQADFSEKLLYLPYYQPNMKRTPSSISEKNDHDLPADSFVYCCFNQTFKITPELFAIWMRLLKQVPNSVLWLLACNQWAKANLEKEAELTGIDKNRLIFAPRTNSETHLERQQHADLFLDTLPYNAHTTASDALSAALPVLTCIGDTFSARVAASLLHHVGLPELVCDSLQAYEEKALQLAQHPTELASIKKQLSSIEKTSDLFDSGSFAKSLEAQYQHVWKTHLHGTSLASKACDKVDPIN
ncbi:MAG: tetratricopeptide repeat protein [Methylophilaceae bacterium]